MQLSKMITRLLILLPLALGLAGCGGGGAQVSSILSGNLAGDRVGGGNVTVLANDNYVVVSPQDNEVGAVSAGTVRLMDGTIAVQIGSTITGNTNGAMVTGSETSSYLQGIKNHINDVV